MKNFKKLFLVPVLALGTVTSCYGSNDNDTKCPEEKKCETCPTPSDQGAVNMLKVTYENGDEVSDTLNLVYDENYPTISGNTKKLKVNAGSNSNIKFKSSDDSVVSVSNDGKLVALQANKYAKVTVTSGSGLSREFEVYTYDLKTFFGIGDNGIVTRCLDTEIEEIVFPESVTQVNGANLGLNLKRLKRMVLNEGCIKVNGNGNDNSPLPSTLEYLYIPSTLELIGSEFFMTPYLKKIEVSEENPYYKVYDNKFLYTTSEHKTTNRKNKVIKGLVGFDGNLTKEMLEETGVTGYSHFALAGSKDVKDLVILPGVSFPRYHSFASSSVETVKVPKSLIDSYVDNSVATYKTVFAQQFLKCPNLSEITIYDDTPVEDTGTQEGESQEGDTQEVEQVDMLDKIITETERYTIYEGSLYKKSTENKYNVLALGSNNGIIHEETKALDIYSFYGRNIKNKKLKIPSNITTLYTCSFLFTNLEKIYIRNNSDATYLQIGSQNYDTRQEASALAYSSKVIGKDGTELFLDDMTIEALKGNGAYGVFTYANPNLHIYDGLETDRHTINNYFDLQGRSHLRFNYSYNVSEEEFDAL